MRVIHCNVNETENLKAISYKEQLERLIVCTLNFCTGANSLQTIMYRFGIVWHKAKEQICIRAS
ncbi:hypothetical protein GCM10028895_11690 [Pontibacter rugosus]